MQKKHPLFETTGTPDECNLHNISVLQREIASLKKQKQEALKEQVLDLEKKIFQAKHPDAMMDSEPLTKPQRRRT